MVSSAVSRPASDTRSAMDLVEVGMVITCVLFGSTTVMISKPIIMLPAASRINGLVWFWLTSRVVKIGLCWGGFICT